MPNISFGIKLFLLLALITGASCTHIVFDYPQPRDGEALSAFPARYQGRYASPEDSLGAMVIGETTVIIPEISSSTISLADLENNPTLSLRDGLLYNSELPHLGAIPYTISDSSLSYAYVSDLYTFGISDTLVIKEMDGMLVGSVNFSGDDLDFWDVFLLELNPAGDLVISGTGNLRTPDSDDDGEYTGDIRDFNKITPYERLEPDTYLFRPDLRAFKKLVKKDLFSDKYTHKRIQ